jgi:DivIVA domain-containing protein
MDRQSIERRDFSIGRRGYEPAEVDAHLRRVADEVESLETAERPGLAAAASDQVRSILEAAENIAAEIRRAAEESARRVTQEAARSAEETLSRTDVESREHVQRVSDAAQVLRQRVDAMQSELGALMESVRTGANRLAGDLTVLQRDMGALQTAGGGPAPVPVPEPAPVPAPAPEALPEPTPVAVEPPPPPPEPEPPVAPSNGDDAEGARLVALNMALSGTPREETDRYLAENFDLPDRDAILDEVYATLGP